MEGPLVVFPFDLNCTFSRIEMAIGIHHYMRTHACCVVFLVVILSIPTPKQTNKLTVYQCGHVVIRGCCDFTVNMFPLLLKSMQQSSWSKYHRLLFQDIYNSYPPRVQFKMISKLSGKAHMHSIHTISRKFPQCYFWNSCNVGLIDNGPPVSSFQDRALTAAFFNASLLQAINGVMSLGLCL